MIEFLIKSHYEFIQRLDKEQCVLDYERCVNKKYCDVEEKCKANYDYNNSVIASRENKNTAV
ncbi:MAG: hypothetical protein LBD23_16060 [Oscillospiraceae bacterium]|jgi:hypothetical protein|nr:hypothetical protein [Oscillospiraceae bacterium]